MIKEPKTIKEKIQYLKECVPYIGSGVLIYGQYALHENYILLSKGEILIRKWGHQKVTGRMEIENFAEKFGDEGLDYAIKRIKLKIRIPEKSA